MKLTGEQTLLRIYLRNTDKRGWFSPPAAEEIVALARRHDLAGATVLRGIGGLDIAGQLLESKPWSLVEHVPVIVEIVDAPQAIGRFLSVLAEVMPAGLATLERGHVLLYRHTAGAAGHAPLPTALPGRVAPLATLPSAEEFPLMKQSEEGQLLRVFIGESDTWQGEPLYRALVLKARELGLAGATVLKGPMGYGANSRLHTAKLLELSTDLPIVVELVDSADKIQLLLPFLDAAVREGLVTLEAVRILHYRPGRSTAAAAPPA